MSVSNRAGTASKRAGTASKRAGVLASRAVESTRSVIQSLKKPLKKPVTGAGSRAPWTLRRRLVLAVVCLLALVSVVIGLVSVAILHASLIDGLDGKLASAVDRARVVVDGGASRFGVTILGPPTALDILNGPAQPPGTLALVLNGATATAVYYDESGAIQSLNRDQVQRLVEQARTLPSSIDLGGAVGEYRIVAQSTRNGSAFLIGLPMASVTGTTTQLVITIAAVSLCGVLLVAVIAAWIVRLALRPLQRVTETAARVADLPLGRGDVALIERVPAADTDARTEVGRVGSAVNRMLDHVDVALETRQASERKVRQFVADASHELRTPLASIRGYSELTRLSRQELPPDTVHALDRIESESVRMTGLVEDLLLLARLDEGRELDRNPVDLTRLLVDVVSDAHAAGPDHHWELDLPQEPLQTIGDAPRLHQVLANLLANARIHTPEGTAVTVALTIEPGTNPAVEPGTNPATEPGTNPASDRAIVTVTDNGPGIPADLQAFLFERFARGDSSRSRGVRTGSTGSTGLGLAIARAVVIAHHGAISQESRPGFTQLRVSLPLAPPPSEQADRPATSEPIIS